MSDQMTIMLDHALYNAGVLGLIKVLSQDKDIEAQIIKKDHSNVVEIPVASLETFPNLYIDYFVKSAAKQSMPLKKIFDDFDCLDYQESEDQAREKRITKKEKDPVKIYHEYLKAKLERASFKSGYEIVTKHYMDSTDISLLVKEASSRLKEKDYRKVQEIHQSILGYLNQHKDVFYFKEATYNILSRFLSGKSFFVQVKEPADQLIKKDFVQPIIDAYQGKRNRNALACSECGEPTVGSWGLTWINDVGVDISRKQSHFWNLQSDTELCPVCRLVYLCMPAGFQTTNGESIFLNANDCISNLDRYNSLDAIKDEPRSIDDIESKLYHGIAEYYKEKHLSKHEHHLPSGIQIIRRTTSANNVPKYEIKDLSEKLYELIKLAAKDLTAISKVWVEQPGSTSKNSVRRPLFSKTVKTVSEGGSLYQEIDRLIRIGGKQEMVGVGKLLNIEMHRKVVGIQLKGAKAMAEKYQKKNWMVIKEAKAAGSNIRVALEGSGAKNAHKRMSGFTYRLLNSLKAGDKKLFMDTLLRYYIGAGKPVPDVFVQAQGEIEELRLAGYSYIAGLKGTEKSLGNDEGKLQKSLEGGKSE